MTKISFYKKILSQNPQFENKIFTKLVTEHFMKFERKIDKYFPSLGGGVCIYKNLFTAKAQILQTGTGILEELVKQQHNGFARNVYPEKIFFEFLVYYVQLKQNGCCTCY